MALFGDSTSSKFISSNKSTSLKILSCSNESSRLVTIVSQYIVVLLLLILDYNELKLRPCRTEQGAFNLFIVLMVNNHTQIYNLKL